MAQLDAFAFTKAIRKRLVDFTLDQNFVRDPHLARICERLWAGPAEGGGLVSELWVEGAFPSESSNDSLDSLTGQGLFSPRLASVLDHEAAVPRSRSLYTHQRQAIVQAQAAQADGARPALVVTAGTGAGKTESFLLPVLNDLFQAPRTGTGIRCLILYPMNALVNDQVDRIYGWLKDQNEVTLFHFTSETPEDRRGADQEGVPNRPGCRKWTRQEARGLEDRNGKRIAPNHPSFGRVPDILITNYSMLEYMLCRPQDACFFGEALRAVVLDEAHLYTGTLAAEITLLLRRLGERCGVPPERLLHIATSATIGREGEEGARELRDFAATLFSKPADLVEVIRGKARRIDLAQIAPPSTEPLPAQIAAQRWLDEPTIEMDQEGAPRLAVNPGLRDRLAENLPLLVDRPVIEQALQGENANYPARLLHATLGSAPLVHRISDILWEKKRLSLRELAIQLWGAARDVEIHALISLLQMGAAARPRVGEYPLLPHRLHLLARAADGLCVCLNAGCSGEEGLTFPGLGCVFAGFSDHCPHCHFAALALHRCANCGETALAGIYRSDGRILPPAGSLSARTRIRFYSLREAGATHAIHPWTGRLESPESENGGILVGEVQDCPHCGIEQKDGWRSFSQSNPLPLTILAETALAELPEYPAANRSWLPARGRRLLAFSDSRQEAARLGPRLTMQHETQLVRAALIRCAHRAAPVDAETIAYSQGKVADAEQRLKQTESPTMRRMLEKELEDARKQLASQTAGGSIEDWLRSLVEEPILRELFEADLSTRYEVDNWKQDAQEIWEANFSHIQSRLAEFVGRELASPVRRFVSVETIGALEVTYPGLEEISPPAHLLGRLPQQVREALTRCWPDFLAALCDSLRRDGAITLGETALDRNYPLGDWFLGRWCIESADRGKKLIRFVGESSRQRRRWFAEEILRRCGLEENRVEEVAGEILHEAFRALYQNAGGALAWIEKKAMSVDNSTVDALQLLFSKLGLRRPAQLYQSTTTQFIWPRSVMECAPELGCNDLAPVSEEALDASPRYGRQRREYLESRVFELGLWAEEHSAQLSQRQNRRLQDLFKLGTRNILSSTTTLELGIDIGGLNCVLMGNVPPGKANYLQRAGRAGRRADGSSVVLTYARPRPYDRAVFTHFEKFLARDLRQPGVLLDRRRIIQRHCNSYLLGEFFRRVHSPGDHVGAMQAFGNMGRFCGVPLPAKWEPKADKPTCSTPAPFSLPREEPWAAKEDAGAGLEPHFRAFLQWVADEGEAQYRPRIEGLTRELPIRLIFDWDVWIREIENAFSAAVMEWRGDYDAVFFAWEASGNPAQANALRYQMAALADITVIEAFADRQFLPRYGFPIGLQKLQVIIPTEEKDGRGRTKIREEDQYRLERPGLMALREYVPGSQLLVGGKLVTSHGLRKHWTGANFDNYIGLTGQFATCVNQHLYYEIAGDLGMCPICGKGPSAAPKKLLLPRHGFSSAAWDPPRRSTKVTRVGSVELATIAFGKQAGEADALRANFAGIKGWTARYREAGELLVFNSGAIYDEDGESPVTNGTGFAICLNCGYADSESHIGEGRIGLPSGFLKHAQLMEEKGNQCCWREGEAPVLRNRTLAAREVTDILLFTFEGALAPIAGNEAIMQTLAQAFQIAGAKQLEVDTRELGVMLTIAGERSNEYGIVLYDNVPGGAGHVRELLEYGAEWVQGALDTMFVDAAHHQRCEMACLDCLLTFDAQEAYEKGLLKRRDAYDLLSAIASNRPPDLSLIGRTTDVSDEEPAPRRTKEERLARREQARGIRRNTETP